MVRLWSHCILQWQVEKDDGATEYIDASEEDQCNWMMFVRPACNPAEQNLVAYQHGTDIYFTVIKDIVPRQELKVYMDNDICFNKQVTKWQLLCRPYTAPDRECITKVCNMYENR